MFSRDVAGIIADYASEHKLLSWIDEADLDWTWLSSNPNAIDLLKANPDKINWCALSKNPSIFEPNRDLILMRLVC